MTVPTPPITPGGRTDRTRCHGARSGSVAMDVLRRRTSTLGRVWDRTPVGGGAGRLDHGKNRVKCLLLWLWVLSNRTVLVPHSTVSDLSSTYTWDAKPSCNPSRPEPPDRCASTTGVVDSVSIGVQTRHQRRVGRREGPLKGPELQLGRRGCLGGTRDDDVDVRGASESPPAVTPDLGGWRRPLSTRVPVPLP